MSRTYEQKQLQPIVNAFAAHLRKQGRRSFSDKTGCMYRGPSGASCGFGGLIADEHYHEELEAISAWTPEVRAALKASGHPNDKIEMDTMRELQMCHDRADDKNFSGSFEAALAAFCEKFEVQYPNVA